MLTLLIWIIIIAALLCLPPVRTGLIWIGVFLLNYFPSVTVVIIVALAIIALPGALLWSIYGTPTLIVLSVLALVSIWSSIARWLTTTILIVGALVALFYPPVNNYITSNFPSFSEWKTTSKEFANTKIAESTIAMKKATIASEVTKGTFGIILCDSTAYDDFGAEITDVKLKKDQPVKSTGLKSKPQNDDSEGMILVAIANKSGDFVNPRSVWIPIRNVKWDSEKVEPKKIESLEPEKVEPKELEAVKPEPIESTGWLSFQHPERNYRDRFFVSIKRFDGDALVIRGTDALGKSFILEANTMVQELFVGRCQWPKGWSDFSIRLHTSQSGEGTIDIPLKDGGNKTVVLTLSP